MSKCDIVLIPYFAELICDEEKPAKVRETQFSALRRLGAILRFYERLGYLDRLVMAIGEKKAEMILATTSKAAMEKVLKPSCPQYTGAGFVPGEYSVPEEELICWSETSFRGPLTSQAHKRYMALFRELFPEQAETLRIE